MTTPPPLKPGDSIGLIAPSGHVPPERIPRAIAAVEAMGYRAAVGGSAAGKLRYLAGGDGERARDINSMFARGDIGGILALRGGYGASRLLPLLDYDAIRENPKFFAGYSDITALHTALNRLCGLVTFHAPMAAVELFRGADRYTLRSFENAAAGKLCGAVRGLGGRAAKALRPGRCRGRLAGGNLASVAAGLGTPYEIDTSGKILFLEEVNEPPYRIDRMLTQLRLASKLDAAAGIALGGFTRCGGEPELMEIWRETLPRGKPIIYNLAAGHCLPNISLALGARYCLRAGEDGRGCLICAGR